MIQPLHDNVLIKRADPEPVDTNAIYVPGGKAEEGEAVVVAVGPGRLTADGSRIPMSVEAGQTVLVGEWVGKTVRIDGVEHLFIKDEALLATL